MKDHYLQGLDSAGWQILACSRRDGCCCFKSIPHIPASHSLHLYILSRLLPLPQQSQLMWRKLMFCRHHYPSRLPAQNRPPYLTPDTYLGSPIRCCRYFLKEPRSHLLMATRVCVYILCYILDCFTTLWILEVQDSNN